MQKRIKLLIRRNKKKRGGDKNKMKIKTKTVVLIGIAACVLLLTSPALGMGEIKVREFEDLKVWQIGKMLSGLINSLKSIHKS